MLVLNVFLNPHPWKAPTSVSTGFCQFLYFLSRWDWKDEPVIVDFGSDISPLDRTNMFKLLETWRIRDANRKQLVLFVATSHVKNGLEYTRLGPSNMAAMRMTSLAKSAADAMKQANSSLDAAALFESRLSDYPVIIHLSSKTIKSIMQEVTLGSATKQSRFKNLDSRTGTVPLPLARHPVDAFLAVLEDTYGDSLTFFSGGPDDMCIGAVWKAARKEKFRAGLSYNFQAVQGGTGLEGAEVEVNKEAVLAETSRLGGDLIKKIELVGE
jgi:U3 small nucleolar RNA-associated protein 22